MAKEILSIPEEYLPEVIGVIRNGLRVTKNLDDTVNEMLTEWCDEEEAYLDNLGRYED